ncbi:MAG TPA: hypothetical protein VIL72_14940 [Beijerinckiaceae bacterium]
MPFVKASEAFAGRGADGFYAEFEAGQSRCSACAIAIKESITGCREMGDGRFCCSDCYYKNMGEELESFPVAPRRLMRRG